MRGKTWFAALALLGVLALPALALAQEQQAEQPAQPPPQGGDVNVDIRETEQGGSPRGGFVSFGDGTWLLVLVIVVALVLIAVAALAGHGHH